MPVSGRAAEFDGPRFADDLQVFCRESNISWRELGRLASVSPATLTRVMRGDAVGVDIVMSLARIAALDLNRYSRQTTA